MLKMEPRQRPTLSDVQRQLAAFLRLPAARRSGFVPQVTPPERRPEPAPKQPPEPPLPSTQSQPLAPVDQAASEVAALRRENKELRAGQDRIEADIRRIWGKVNCSNERVRDFCCFRRHAS
jgi:hypothetical protein